MPPLEMSPLHVNPIFSNSRTLFTLAPLAVRVGLVPRAQLAGAKVCPFCTLLASRAPSNQFRPLPVRICNIGTTSVEHKFPHLPRTALKSVKRTRGLAAAARGGPHWWKDCAGTRAARHCASRHSHTALFTISIQARQRDEWPPDAARGRSLVAARALPPLPSSAAPLSPPLPSGTEAEGATSAPPLLESSAE